ncbi:hypothetical protein BsWGS_24753 [Bradybaena similaris]
MAAGRIASLMLLLSVPTVVNSIKDGQAVSQCDYPGLVLLVLPENGLIICHGVRSNGVLYLPELCGRSLSDILPFSESLALIYGDGTKNITISINSTGTLNNGIFQMDIPEPLEPDCNGEATLFNTSMAVNSSTCELVSYGGDRDEAKIYDGSLKAAQLTKSTSTTCCMVILNSLTFSQKGVFIDPQSPRNCVASSGSTCGLADLGAPVYCKTTAGAQVVMGLTASFPCENGGTFVLNDFTDADSSFKFGITG